MKQTHKTARMAVLLVAVALFVGTSAVGAEEGSSASQAPPGGQTVSMAKFYVGSHGNIGTFPGKLVCLRCDLGSAPGREAQCKKEGHRHALSMDDDSMIHPLVSGTEEVLKEINSTELHGKKVVVHGKHYPSTGFIFVDQIALAE